MKDFVLTLMLLLSGFSDNQKPDLIIASIQRTAEPVIINAQHCVEVPIKVVVKNNGNTKAGVFKVGIEYLLDGRTFTVAFTVPGEGNSWYPYTDGPMPAGQSVSFKGKVTFHPTMHNVTVRLKANADSCSGDEFMPDYCRVKENKESNNASSYLRVTLP